MSGWGLIVSGREWSNMLVAQQEIGIKPGEGHVTVAMGFGLVPRDFRTYQHPCRS